MSDWSDAIKEQGLLSVVLQKTANTVDRFMVKPLSDTSNWLEEQAFHAEKRKEAHDV